jgi:hypothetical protein
MRIQIDVSSLREMRWYQAAIRFGMGGMITVATGLIAKKYGPLIGGLFLAFPAILPASVTLIEKHERQKKERIGMHGALRARQAAAIDAAGAAIGSFGLLGFGLVIARCLPGHETWFVMAISAMSWMVVSVLLWLLRKRM